MSKDLQAIKYLNDTCINFLDRTKELYCTVTFTRKRAEILRDNIAEVEQALQRLEAIEKGKNTDIIDNYMAFKNDNANPSEALKCLERIDKEYLTIESKDFDNCFNTIKQALLKAQEQEKENELLKEIIKSLFDRGCPLHQYTDKEGVLTIEVDSECSIMRIGIYKGVDLDKTLKEVLK